MMHSPEPTPTVPSRLAAGHSPELGELAKALAAVQSEIGFARKTAVNPHFKNTYANLADIWDACRAALTKNGLSVVQVPDTDGERVVLTTTLLHTSGQWIRGVYPVRPVKNDPQSYGSALTYARRYGLAAMVGVVADDDDDGQRASTPSRQQPGPAYYDQQPRQGYAPPPQDDFPPSYGGPPPEVQTVAPPAGQGQDPRLVQLYNQLAGATATTLIEAIVHEAKKELGDDTPAFLAFRQEALKQFEIVAAQEDAAATEQDHNPIAAE